MFDRYCNLVLIFVKSNLLTFIIYKDDPNIGVVWTKRGRKFSNRSSGIQTESLSIAILIITNFQKEDLGIYVCKAKPLNPSKYLVKGESHRYLMASEFGFDQSEQILINPDVNVQVYCGEREEMREENLCTNHIQHGANVLFTCNIENFGRKSLFKLFF
jgi:hypothetical protein